MKVSKFLMTKVQLILAFLLLLISYNISKNNEKPYLVINKQDESINFNDQLLTHFNLGLKRLISSTLWISTILESDIEHYKKKDLNSWMFLRFKSISNLEPQFYENYSFGGLYLSIIKDDLEGASYIYNTGLLMYPDDYKLLRDAGFHFYFEVGDLKRAYEIYSTLKNNPKSNMQILSTLARLESNKGNLVDAFELLFSKYNELSDKNSFIAKKMYQNLYSLKAEIDLNCLNGKKELKCSLSDLDKNPYLYKDGKYFAAKNWTSFRVKNKKNKSN